MMQHTKKLRGQSRGFTTPSEERRENSFSWRPNDGGAHPRQSRGFTLLLAVLISSIMLALGFAIYNIVAKDLILSSSGRESQFAFYASDTGIECALYWDGEPDAFSLGSGLDSISCGGANVPLNSIYDGVNVVTTTFSLSLGEGDTSPCANLIVQKFSTPRKTIVESRGYNTCVLTNPRRIERAIRVQY